MPLEVRGKAVSVDVRGLRRAIIAAQHKSLRQAADTLHIRQSTLSRGLRELEYRLGAALFERTNGGIRPTIAGQEFLDSARHLIEEVAGITDRLRARAQGQSGLCGNRHCIALRSIHSHVLNEALPDRMVELLRRCQSPPGLEKGACPAH